jgi:drug/metabolite transporter (DMT)-like permease
MAYLYLLSAISAAASLSIFAAFYNRKNPQAKHGSPLYNLITTASAFLVWCIIYAFDFSFNAGTLPYSIGFGIFYAMAMLGTVSALKVGAVSITAFVKQLSLVLVAVWSFVFWDAQVKATVITGLILIVLALFLCLGKARRKRENQSLLWLFYILLIIIGNAGCSIIQKNHQAAFGGQHGTMLMVFGTLISVLTAVIYAAFSKKTEWLNIFKTSFYLPTFAGIGSAALNIFVIKLIATTLSPSVFYPAIAAGGLILTTLASVVLYKERLKAVQWIGILTGAVAIILLNI